MNIAGRLLSIYDKLTGSGLASDKAMVWVWTEVFDIPHDTPNVEDVVVTFLQAMRAELDLLQVKLLALGASFDLTQPGIPRLRAVGSAVYLNTSWSALREEASRPDNRLTFLWASWALQGEDEGDLTPDELSGLRSEFDSLEASLLETDMSPYLRDFVQRQIDAIRTALRVYRVQGVKPVEAALRQVAGAYTIEKVRIEAEHEKASEPAKSLLARTGAMIEKTAKVADNLDKIRKAGEGAYSLATSVGPLLLSFGQSLLK